MLRVDVCQCSVCDYIIVVFVVAMHCLFVLLDVVVECCCLSLTVLL